MKKDEKKKLVAFRLPEGWAQTLQELPEIVGFSQQRITEDAMAILFGSTDDLIKQRHEMIVSAIKKGKVHRPFNSAPDFHNALCATAN